MPPELEDSFEGLACHKFDRFAGLDFDLLTGFRVHPNARLTAGDLEGSETDQLDGFGLFDAELDSINHGRQRAFGLSRAGIFSEGFLNLGHEFCFGHGLCLITGRAVGNTGV